MRNLMFIDSSYTLSEIRERRMEHVLNIRHLGGYWGRVVSAHPLDLRVASHNCDNPFGRAKVERISSIHSFVRGRFGRFGLLARFTSLNAFLALANFIFTLVRVGRKNKISAVRAGDPLICGLIGFLVARAIGAKFIVRIPANNAMIRANIKGPTQPRFTRTVAIEDLIERLIIPRADIIIAPSNNYADFAVSQGARRENIHLVRYGANIEPMHQISPSERPAFGDALIRQRLAERPWMLHVGRLDEIKHIEDCFDVLEGLASDGSDVGLILVGDGPLRAVLEKRVEENNLCNRVLFLGNVTQHELFSLFPYASIVLSPLTGRALAEAAFAACAIVAYDLDWQGELIQNGETGILVEARDSKAMAVGVKHLLSDPIYAKKLGSAVRSRAINMLSADVTGAAEKAAYDALWTTP